MIRIDAIRELRRDLHMRPFEADRRVYLIQRAHLLGDDAADALLKDLEEPPSYAVIVLVADDLGPIPETIRSRCQLVPFRRLSRAGDSRGGGHARARARRGAARRPRTGRGRAARQGRAAARPQGSLEARNAARAGARRLPRARVRARRPRPRRSSRAPASEGRRRRPFEEANVAGLELTARESDQRVRRAQRGAEREELLAQLEELEAWYRDLVVVAVGAAAAAAHVDRLGELRDDATRERLVGAEHAAEAVRETWRKLEEFNLAPQLALEALFVQISTSLRRKLCAMNYVVFVEIPGGSRNKYEWDDELGGIVPRPPPVHLDELSGRLRLPRGRRWPRTATPSTHSCWSATRPSPAAGSASGRSACFHMSDEKGADEKIICVPLNDPSWGRLSDIHDVPSACATRSSTSSRSTRTSTTRERWRRGASATVRRPRT